MVRLLIIFLILLLQASLVFGECAGRSGNSQGFVDDFECNGILGRGSPNLSAPLGSFFAGLYAHLTPSQDICSDNDVEDLTAIQCSGGRVYTYVRLTADQVGEESAGDLRNMSEELVFLEAARRIHNFSQCQASLYNSLDSDPAMREDFTRVAFDQFNEIRGEVATEGNTRAGQRNIANENASIVSAYATRPGMSDLSQEAGYREITADRAARASDQKLRELLSRMPLGNRPEMKEAMTTLARRNGNITFDAFRTAYFGAIETLQGQANTSLANFTGRDGIYIERRGADGSIKQYYNVDQDFKEQIAASYQIQNIVDDLGLTDTLEQGFTCRVRQRYVRGPIAFEVAQIPLYFTGYGVARLGARVAVSAAGRLARAARGLNNVTRAALIGMETLDVATTANSVRRCVSQRSYLDGSQSGASGDCNPETEVFNAFNEATMAQCATEAAIAGVSLGAPALNRLVRSPRLRSRLGLTGPPEAEESIIRVIAGGGSSRPPAFVNGDDFADTLDNLTDNGIFNQTALTIRPDRASRLNTRQRAVVFEYINEGNSLTSDQARRLNRLADSGSLDRTELRAIIADTGVPAGRVDDIADQIVDSNLLGVRRAPTTGPNRAVAGVVTPPGGAARALPTPANDNIAGTLLSRENLDNLLTGIERTERNGTTTALNFSRQTRNEIYDRLSNVSVEQRQVLQRLLSENPAYESQYLAMVLNSSDSAATLNRLGRLTPSNRASIISELDELIAAAPNPQIRSQLMQERFLIENGDNLEITRIFSANAHNDSISGIGHSLQDSFGMDFRVRPRPDGERLMLCRGSYGTTGSMGLSGLAGGFLTLCRGSGYNDRGQLVENLAAPNDVDALFPGYDRFSRFEARAGEEFSFGLNGDVRYRNGSGGSGGGVEVYNSRTGGSVDAQADLRASVRIPVCEQSSVNCTSLFESQANIRAGDLVGANASDVTRRLDAAETQVNTVIQADFDPNNLQRVLRENPDANAAVNQFMRDNPELTSAFSLRREIDLKRDVNFSAGDSLDLETRNLQNYVRTGEAASEDATRIANISSSQDVYNRQARNYLDNHSLVSQYRQRQTQVNELVSNLRTTTDSSRQLEILQQISNLRGQQSDLLIGIKGVESQLRYAPNYGRGLDGEALIRSVLSP